MDNFRRIVRRTSRRFRAVTSFSRGAGYALFHLREFYTRFQETNAKNMAELQKVSEFLDETEQAVLFGLIGRALSAWAAMEEAIVMVFCTLLRLEPEKAGLILYSIINFNVWLTLIDELFAADERFSSFRPRWNKIGARIQRIKDDRDRLAHHGVTSGSRNNPFVESTTLRPSSLDTRRKTLKFQPMDNDHILEFAETVAAIGKDLVLLAKDMIAVSREISQQPEADRGSV